MSMRFHRVIPPDAAAAAAEAAAEEEPRRPSSVHVLNGEEDLRAALQRAAAFDQRAAEALRSRSARYRALLGETSSPAEQAS